jgi:hypothetical protein
VQHREATVPAAIMGAGSGHSSPIGSTSYKKQFMVKPNFPQ